MSERITTFHQLANGGHNRAFVVNGIKVMVEASEDDATARAIAETLSTAVETLAEYAEEVRVLKAAMPPKAPSRIFGIGYVRMRDGSVWMMNKRETGWASFAIRFESWDELFRHFGVIVTGNGADEHGAWWSVVNAPVSK